MDLVHIGGPGGTGVHLEGSVTMRAQLNTNKSMLPTGTLSVEKGGHCAAGRGRTRDPLGSLEVLVLDNSEKEFERAAGLLFIEL